MTFPAISTLVPHDAPMVLLDRVLAIGEESLVAEVTITPESQFFDGAGVGAWVGMEYMAQAISAYAGNLALQLGNEVKVGFLLGSRRYECYCPSYPLGSVIQVHIQRILQNENGLGAFECRLVRSEANAPLPLVANDTTLLATATITVFQPENANEFLQNFTL